MKWLENLTTQKLLLIVFLVIIVLLLIKPEVAEQAMSYISSMTQSITNALNGG